MYDDVLNWFRSPFMMFLIVMIAGGLGYLQATNNMHYLKNLYNMGLFMYQNVLKNTGQAKLDSSNTKETK